MKSFVVLTLLLGLSWALDECPTAESAYTGNYGSKFAICRNTDLRGGTLQVFANTASANACARICDGDGRCLRAVFDHQTGDCHIKDEGDRLDWVDSDRYDVIRLNDALPQGTVISKCPYTTGTYKSPSGTWFQVCPGTDLRGNTAQLIDQVADRATCQQRCGSTKGCRAAVYDKIDKKCHLKDFAPDATLVWATTRRFDVIQTIRTYDPATQGQWSDIVRLPVIPAAVYVVPEFPSSTRLLAFSSWAPRSFGGSRGYTAHADYNWVTGAVSERTVSNTHHDMFCPGINALGDGRIMITGGDNAEVTSLYNPTTNDFTRGPDMKIARGYQAAVTLSDGRGFTIGGSWSGGVGGQDQGVPYKNGEVFDPVANTWTVLEGADVRPMLTHDAAGRWRDDNHGWLFAWRNGSVFQAGPSVTQHWYGTDGDGSVVEAGARPGANDQMCGVSAMYDIGKILSAGGSKDYTDSPAVAMAHITSIGAPGAKSSAQRVSDMNWPRGFANAVVLPDGTTLVTGGQKRSLVFTDTDSVMQSELFKPATQSWTKMAAEAVPRNYHSAAVLLADARVWSGGGGLCWDGGGCNPQADHADGQIFSPPYLFKGDGTAATRPVISSLSTTTPRAGAKITVKMNASTATTFALVRIGSATHSVNTDQRRVPLAATRSSSTFEVTLPNDTGVLPPGHYHLFAITAGVPSIAKTVHVVS